MSNPTALSSILTWCDFEGQEQTKPLPEGELHIGRHPSNDIVVPDPTVSRRHATILFRDLRHYIVDLSMSGTYLNGERIPQNAERLLSDDDVIQIGKISFTFRDPFKTMSHDQFAKELGPEPGRVAHIPAAQPATPGVLNVNLETGEVKIGNYEVSLTPKEFALLSLLFQHQERACTRPEIRRYVWPERDGDDEQAVSDEEIDGLVRRLRQKIEPDRSNPRHIITVRQVRGYRFKS
jgi:DNA-binding winged helix-turn-helix (wHTH) protein